MNETALHRNKPLQAELKFAATHRENQNVFCKKLSGLYPDGSFSTLLTFRVSLVPGFILVGMLKLPPLLSFYVKQPAVTWSDEEMWSKNMSWMLIGWICRYICSLIGLQSTLRPPNRNMLDSDTAVTVCQDLPTGAAEEGTLQMNHRDRLHDTGRFQTTSGQTCWLDMIVAFCVCLLTFQSTSRIQGRGSEGHSSWFPVRKN